MAAVANPIYVRTGLSEDDKARILSFAKSGYTFAEIAVRYNITAAAVQEVLCDLARRDGVVECDYLGCGPYTTDLDEDCYRCFWCGKLPGAPKVKPVFA